MMSSNFSHPDLAVQRIQRDGRFSDEEAREILERASEIQSQTLFAEENGLSDVELEKGANRAGISDAALEAAIKEREQDRVAAIEKEKQRAAQKARLTKNGLIAAGIFAAIAGLTLFSANNSLGARVQAVQSAQSQVENVLERRHNLVPNLISVTKATLQNQQELIEKLNVANQSARNASSPEAKLAAETQLGGVVSQTLEALKSGKDSVSPVVLRLSDEMAGAENRISTERRKYNQAVEQYNRTAGSFPLGFAGRLLGYKPHYDYFQASEGAKEAPKF